MEISKWKENTLKMRRAKDSFFARDLKSPISPEDRARFICLEYYPPDPDYLFAIELDEHNDKETLQIEDTGGNIRNFIRWGEFKFKIRNTDCVLQTYKSNPEEHRLFIPFRDATGGKETYPAGRYIDLDYEKNRLKDGKWILDFNKAYNPWCAYSKNYVCPFVPPENWLKVPILAGEKNYNL